MKKYIPLLFLIPLTMFFSCQNETRWYPNADVEVASHVEYTDAGTGGGSRIKKTTEGTECHGV
jgi:hypothetical protein